MKKIILIYKIIFTGEWDKGSKHMIDLIVACLKSGVIGRFLCFLRIDSSLGDFML